MDHGGSVNIFTTEKLRKTAESGRRAGIGRRTLGVMLAFCLGLSAPMTALADEVLIAIDDGPVDDAELGISDADLAAATDGSMIPEYKISDVSETKANVVSESYAVAQDSAATETTKETATTSGGSDKLLEVVDTVDDFSAFKRVTGGGIASAASSAVSNLTTAATTAVAAASSAISGAVSNAVSAVTGSTTSKSSKETKSGVSVTTANAALSGGIAVVEASSSKKTSTTTTSLPTIATTATRQELIYYAKQFLGNPYVYGGTSLTNGADCSGFVQQIFKHFGIDTGRSSRDQYENAQSISFSELQPGDLVFYGSGDYINHVAIYAGDGVIIHAANERTGICTGRYDYRTPAGYGRFLQN